MIQEVLSPLANHLWQSTVFAVAAGLLTLAFQRNRASVRYSLWLVASVKFLIPFSLLVNLGGQFHLSRTSAFPTPVPVVLRGISQPFTISTPAHRPPLTPSPSDPLPAVLLCVWFSGFAFSVGAWLHQWRRVRATLRDASPLPLDLPDGVTCLTCPSGRLEPGVFGVIRPVLLLPEGVADHLTPAQLQAVLVHELCHVRRRDNLAAAIHMLVESIFWFHPLVWWIEKRLIEEREAACDEEVLRITGEPEVYAEGILNISKLYCVSPLACVSGVTGINLSKRIEAIMTHRVAHNLKFGKKTLLAAAAIATLSAPIVIGILHLPQLRAQEGPRLAFETASVKPNKSADPRMMRLQYLPGGKISATNIPAYVFVAEAYNVGFQSMRLSGGDKWLRTEGYDIEAAAAPGTVPGNLSTRALKAKVRLMLQSLLADRFKMVVRREMKELPVYALVVGKNGLKLQKAAIEEKDCVDDPSANGIKCHQVGGGQGRGIHGQALDISDVTGFVENWSDRPVIDQTGLKGLFVFDTEGWVPMRGRPMRDPANPTPEDLAMADPTRPTLYQIFDRVGLKMEPQKAPVETFVIESAERPSEN